jgi:hypothetical protein
MFDGLQQSLARSLVTPVKPPTGDLPAAAEQGQSMHPCSWTQLELTTTMWYTIECTDVSESCSHGPTGPPCQAVHTASSWHTRLPAASHLVHYLQLHIAGALPLFAIVTGINAR